MKRTVRIIAAVAAAAVAFSAFVALAQAHAIFAPYFTPTRIDFQGLEDQYPVNGSMNYEISVKGYGSNCIAFEAQMVRESSELQEQAAYYGEIQDCRKIEISQGPYNYTQSFSYGGPVVLNEPGNYHINVGVFDQITRQNYADTRSFIVVDDSY